MRYKDVAGSDREERAKVMATFDQLYLEAMGQSAAKDIVGQLWIDSSSDGEDEAILWRVRSHLMDEVEILLGLSSAAIDAETRESAEKAMAETAHLDFTRQCQTVLEGGVRCQLLESHAGACV